jgi:hypothetical protein
VSQASAAACAASAAQLSSIEGDRRFRSERASRLYHLSLQVIELSIVALGGRHDMGIEPWKQLRNLPTFSILRAPGCVQKSGILEILLASTTSMVHRVMNLCPKCTERHRRSPDEARPLG